MKSCWCCDLKDGNVFICRMEFMFNILGIAFGSLGGIAFYFVVLNDIRFSEDQDGFLRSFFYEYNCICE
jgi:hypothetical protein